MTVDNAEGRVIEDVRTAARDLPPGSRLPSVRALMARHRASPVTVQRALAQLAAEGLVVAHPGRGTFVAGALAAPARTAEPDLAWQELALAGRPTAPAAAPAGPAVGPELQPHAALGAALARATRRPEAWEPLGAGGLAGLGAWFARAAGVEDEPGDVAIAAGRQAAIAAALRALAAPGDPVLVESPTAAGALAAVRGAGARPVPVPADGDGVRPELLAAAFALTGARVFCCQPLFAEPTGATLAAGRRGAVLEAVAAAGAFLVEDDAARDLALDGPTPPSLAAEDPGGHVVAVRSLARGPRVAAVTARGAAAARLRRLLAADGVLAPEPLQHAALELLGAAGWRRQLREVRSALRERRDTLLDALAGELPQARVPAVPAGGAQLWVRLPDGTDDVALSAAAGPLVAAGGGWFAAEPPAPFLRIAYGAGTPSELVGAVRRLAGAWPA